MVKVVQFPSIEAEAVSYEVRWQVTWSGGRLPLLCGWEGNRRSGIALAMCHRLCGLSTYGLNVLGKGDEHPPTLPRGAVYLGVNTPNFRTTPPASSSDNSP